MNRNNAVETDAVSARFPKKYADTVAKLRVPFGFLLVVAFGWLADPTILSIFGSLPLSIAGLLLRAWAAGHLAKNQELATGGPYGYLRNPLYLGTLMVAAGLVVAAQRWELAILFAAVFGLVYLPVIELEEQHLRKLFPSYSEYAQSVPSLWPKLSRVITPELPGGRFQIPLYMKNQEYQALLGYIAGVVFLVWKSFSGIVWR